MSEKLLSVREAGYRLGYCDEHVRRLMRSGALYSEKHGRLRMTTESAVSGFIERRQEYGEQMKLALRWLAVVRTDVGVLGLESLIRQTFPFPESDVRLLMDFWAEKVSGTTA
jgi:hypothetical protein